jgi:ketosteroid isomerase-like protein
VVEQPLDEARAEVAEWTDPSFADNALRYWAGLVDEPEPVTGTVEEITGRPARPFATWAADHADDFRALSTAEVAQRYTAAFRSGRMDEAVRLCAPDILRLAPIEGGGELRGLASILANAQRLNADLEFHAVDVAGPYLHEDQFAVRFEFDQTHIPTGRRSTSAKMSLYTVTDGAIVREEVFYLNPPPAGR